jgi:hypothetical protein
LGIGLPVFQQAILFKKGAIRIMNRLSETVFRNGRLELDENDQGNETCNECGQSIRKGSGRFVNRVIDLNGYKTRQGMGKPHHVGDYICAECEAEQDAQPGEVLQFPDEGREERR